MSFPRNKTTIFILATLGALLIFWIDYITIERYSFYLFYFLPVIAAAWFVGNLSAYVMVLFCTAVWFKARLVMEPPPTADMLAWNTAIRFISFLLIARVMIVLREKQTKMDELYKKLESALELEKNNARRDSLTGALNSRAFYEKLTDERSRSKRYHHKMSLLYIDLDDFKKVNDLRGHEMGDELLKKVVLVMQECVRDVDVLSRMGGDEFVVLLPETDLKGAERCAERIREALQKSISKETTVSVGIAYFNTIPDTNEEVLRRADDAMYQAKRGGKNRGKSIVIQ